MFEATSRYYLIEDAEYPAPDGRTIRYKRRRFLPQGSSLPLFVEVPVLPDERLDALTMRTLGDPMQFWQVCDANNGMDPFDLVAETGLVVRIPLPQFQGS